MHIDILNKLDNGLQTSLADADYYSACSCKERKQNRSLPFTQNTESECYWQTFYYGAVSVFVAANVSIVYPNFKANLSTTIDGSKLPHVRNLRKCSSFAMHVNE